jgi:hypothetical protein
LPLREDGKMEFYEAMFVYNADQLEKAAQKVGFPLVVRTLTREEIDLITEKAPVAQVPLQCGVSHHEREIAQLKAIIKLIDETVPLADDTCDEPGITFSKACRRQLTEDNHQLFTEGG